jgi:hypothetical protein
MKRNLSVDILKFVMAFFIVGLHGELFVDLSYSLSYFFTQGIARTGVPVFLLISGFYFYEIKDKAKFKNWIKRLFYLYIIWMIVVSIYWLKLSYKSVIQCFILGYGPLWYLIGALYAFIFVWIIRNINLKMQVALIVVCGIVGIFLQYRDSYDLMSDPNLFYKLGLNTYRNGLFFCFPFIMIGYFINKFSLQKKHVNWLLLLIVGICLLLIETFINYTISGKGFDILLSLYILCPVLFIYTLNKEFYSTNKTLALYSTGIYLTHWIVLREFRRFEILSDFQTFRVVIVLLLSMFITFFLIKLKKKFKYIL